MLKSILIVLFVLGIIGVAGAGWAKHNGYCQGGDRLQHVSDRVTRKLDLNETQQGKLQALVETLREVRGDRGVRKTRLRERIDGLLSAETLDRGQALAFIEERQQEINTNKTRVVDAFADFSDSLSAQQRGALSELIAKRLEGRSRHHRGHGE